MFHNNKHLGIFLLVNHLQNYDYFFRVSPRKFKIHRSTHPYLLFGISLYIPYRFDAHFNTMLFQITKSSNTFVNMLARVPAKVVIYGASIMIDDCTFLLGLQTKF